MPFPLRPTDLSFLETAPHRFVNEVDLDAPPGRVFELLVAPDSWPRFFKEVRKVTWVDPPSATARRTIELDVVTAHETMLAFEPGARFAFTITSLSLPLVAAMAEDLRLSPREGGGTRLTWTAAYDTPAWLSILHPVLRGVFGRQFRNAAQGLKRIAR